MSMSVFQSTFPRGERHGVLSEYPFKGDFNPRSRVGNDNLTDDESTENNIFQSTFPRGERPVSGAKLAEQADISIHVPAWGTTLWDCIS